MLESTMHDWHREVKVWQTCLVRKNDSTNGKRDPENEWTLMKREEVCSAWTMSSKVDGQTLIYNHVFVQVIVQKHALIKLLTRCSTSSKREP